MEDPCGACRFRKKGCKRELCVFAPYFPPEKRKRFEFLNRVFGASKVSQVININSSHPSHSQRNEAIIHSLSYEAEQRIRDPVFGCVTQLTLLQADLAKFEREIATVKNQIEAAYGKQPVNLSQAADHAVLASQMLNPLTARQEG